jgi:hypothetical protein
MDSLNQSEVPSQKDQPIGKQLSQPQKLTTEAETQKDEVVNEKEEMEKKNPEDVE